VGVQVLAGLIGPKRKSEILLADYFAMLRMERLWLSSSKLAHQGRQAGKGVGLTIARPEQGLFDQMTAPYSAWASE
jgi:hypothetical protein